MNDTPRLTQPVWRGQKRVLGAALLATLVGLGAGACGGSDDTKLPTADSAESSSPSTQASSTVLARQFSCDASLVATGAIEADVTLDGRSTLESEESNRPAATYALSDGVLKLFARGYTDASRVTVELRSAENITYVLSGSGVKVNSDGSGIVAEGEASPSDGSAPTQISLKATCS